MLVACKHYTVHTYILYLVYLVHCERYRRRKRTVVSLVRVTVHSLRSFCSIGSLLCVTGARLAQLPQGWLRCFTCVCVKGFAQGSLRCCYRRRWLAQLVHSLVCVTGLAQLRGLLGVGSGADGWLSWFIHLCVLQVWLSWGSLLCVKGAGLAQFVHLCVLQVWLDWGVTSVCYRRRAGSVDSLVCVTGLD